jgi:hypothetical protein
LIYADSITKHYAKYPALLAFGIDNESDDGPISYSERYLPDQGLWNLGIITNYQFYVSNDNVEWKLADDGEFSNIKNNPLWQIKKFALSMPVISS